MELTIEMFMSLIGSVGFPIVCCFMLWKYINTTMKDFTKTMENLLTGICDRLDMWKTENEKERTDKSE